MRSVTKNKLYFFIRNLLVRKFLFKSYTINGLPSSSVQPFYYGNKSKLRLGDSLGTSSESVSSRGDANLKFILWCSLYSLGFFNSRKFVVKIRFRSFFSLIDNRLIGFNHNNYFLVYNGFEYKPLKIFNERMSGIRVGSFIFNKRKVIHKKYNDGRKPKQRIKSLFRRKKRRICKVFLKFRFRKKNKKIERVSFFFNYKGKKYPITRSFYKKNYNTVLFSRNNLYFKFYDRKKEVI